jgi:hypothetical protein
VKKLLSFLLMACMLFAVAGLSGCGGKDKDKDKDSKKDEKKDDKK